MELNSRPTVSRQTSNPLSYLTGQIALFLRTFHFFFEPADNKTRLAQTCCVFQISNSIHSTHKSTF